MIIPYGAQNDACATTIAAIRKELALREHIPDKSKSKQVRKIRARYKLTKAQAIKKMEEGVVV